MIKTRTCFLLAMLSVSGLLLSGCAQYMKEGGGPGSAGTTGTSTSASAAAAAPATGPNRVASGTQGDTLEACLARIPSDATESQRMLAELTCQRDANFRKPIDLVPGQ